MALLTAGAAEIADHGGSVERARALFPGAPEPWIDLSTGISPHAYPLFPLPATAFSRLPEPGRARELAAAAARAYGARADHVVPAPGTQILLPLVAALVLPGRARVLGPTYAEHARAAAIAGHAVEEVTGFEALFDADLAVVVNPNNPDGRLIGSEDLLGLTRRMRARGGLLVVDEAFMDVGPAGAGVADAVGAGGLVVLRSFGKFYGLAGLRLGFAIASSGVARALESRLGPWAVSGPALEIGLRALGDMEWRDAMRARLAADAARLDGLLAAAGLAVEGGTSLFRLLRTPEAPGLFSALGESGILTRRFDARPNDLRIGLPGGEEEWRRVADALDGWRERGRSRPAGAVR